mgnify:CR=1 FL=1
MDFGLYQKHETFIKERWLPISVEFMLQEGPEKKISFLKEAQQQASKEIQNIEEKSVFIGFLEIEILNIQNKLSKNGATKAQMTVQRNETLNTDESTQKAQNTWKPVEKINWKGTETQLVLLVDLLTQEALLKSDRKWKMIEEHFLVQGKPTKSKNLSQSLENTLAGKTKDVKTLKEIISEVKKLED